jgi:hypothetical protein
VKYYLTIFFLIWNLSSSGQDLTRLAFEQENDSLSVFSFHRTEPIPKRSALYSAIFPGLGQIYNKQYWKLGVVAAGLGAAGYFIQSNGSQYKKFRAAYIARIDNNPSTTDEYVGFYQDNDLNTLQNTYRQYLEYSVIFTTVGYALNVLDAYVAAHLKSFDIDNSISFKTKPSFDNGQLGVALVVKFK